MKTEIKSIGFISGQKLKNFIYAKVNNLVRFYREVIGSEIFLQHEHSLTMEKKVVQIKLVIPRKDLLASAQNKDLNWRL